MNSFLGFLQVTPVTEQAVVRSLTGIPAIDQAIQMVINYTPKVIGAIVLLIVAWIVASIVRNLVGRGLRALKIDERLSTAQDANSGAKVIGTLSDVIYWIIFLCFVPMILGTLGLDGILAPVQTMLNNILGFLPNVLGAALIFVLGLLVAQIVQQLVTSILEGLGLNSFGEKMGVGNNFGAGGLAGLIGTVVYVLMVIPVVSLALDALRLEAVSKPISNLINIVLSAIPNLFGAALILVAAYFIGRVVSTLVTNLLSGMGFNNVPAALGITSLPVAGERSASAFIGTLSFVAIMFFAVMEAARMLNFALLSEIVETVTVFGGQLLAGLVIFAIGLYLAQLAANLIRQSGVNNAETLAMIARIAVLVFTGAMALRRTGLADEIVNLAFGLTLGAIAVAAAIAFGIGGRETAARILNGFYNENKP